MQARKTTTQIGTRNWGSPRCTHRTQFGKGAAYGDIFCCDLIGNHGWKSQKETIRFGACLRFYSWKHANIATFSSRKFSRGFRLTLVLNAFWLYGVFARRCSKHPAAPRCAVQSLVLWPKRLQPKCQIGIAVAPALAPALSLAFAPALSNSTSEPRGTARTYQELRGAWCNGFDLSTSFFRERWHQLWLLLNSAQFECEAATFIPSYTRENMSGQKNSFISPWGVGIR